MASGSNRRQTVIADQRGVEVRRIIGFRNHYISRDGIPYSFYNRKLRKLTSFINKHGYVQIGIGESKSIKAMRLHRCVLLAFSGRPKKGQVARHLDGNKLNNHIENLVWGTHKENRADMVRHGTVLNGEKHWKVRLNELQVRIIRRCKSLSAKFIGSIFDVNRETIYSIWNGSNWDCLPESNNKRANALTAISTVYRKLNFAQYRIMLRCRHLPTNFLCRIFSVSDFTVLKFKNNKISYKRCKWHNKTLGQYVRDLVV